MSVHTYDIDFSFFPLATSDFEFRIYRRRIGNAEQSVRDTRMLPMNPQEEAGTEQAGKRERFEVSYLAKEGFESYNCHSWASASLTLDVLYNALKSRCEEADLKDAVILPKQAFSRHVAIILLRDPDGDQAVWLRPYALRATGEFGFIADFKFYAKENAKPTRRTLELSLAQKGGRENRDFYADRFEKIQSFIQKYDGQLKTLALHDESKVGITFTQRVLHAYTLKERIYLLQGDVEVVSPFQGLRKAQPLKAANPNSRVIFLYREQDKLNSQELFRALRGDLFPTFPGMRAVFKTVIDKTNTSGMVIPGFEYKDVDWIAADLKSRFEGFQIVPVAVVPFSKHKSPEETAGYYRAKHAFLKHGLPSQFIDRARFDNKELLKWSVSNIGLALFAKMGGHPWKVKPATARGLVIGIGQAHRKVDGEINRYFAYSVLTDSSGLYEKIRVLGSSSNQSEYLGSLKQKLREVLLEHKDTFNSFVIHATFSIRRSELEIIEQTIREVAGNEGKGKEFVVLKFNDHNDFFGYSRSSNSKVPFESTVVRLSSSDYLVWFEGLNRGNPTVLRRPERPVHVHVTYPTAGLPQDQIDRVLQDSVNIAGANWRGFNARSMPISVYYAKLIADYYGCFQELGLDEIDFENLTPWFL